ncbi:MAG: NAD(P)-dependent oxidoreductase [Planctomycetota bacterium]
MKVLLTGASGFIGGRFLARWQGIDGFEFLGLGRRPLARPDYRALDLSEPFTLDFRPDVVVHAAALAAPFARRAEYERHNVRATANVLAFCRAVGRPKLVYLSSSSVFYRPCDQFDLNEDAPIGPNFANDYAATKAAGEVLVRAYVGPWVILRPRAVFGPGDTVLFPRLLAAARQGKLPRIVRRGKPAVGDLIAVDALVDYLARACARPVVGEYNLTNGEPVVLQEFLDETFRRLDLPVPRRRVPYRVAWSAAFAAELLWKGLRLRGEPPVTRFGVDVLAFSKTFDVRRARAALGPPSITLEQGLSAFVAWQRAESGA